MKWCVAITHYAVVYLEQFDYIQTKPQKRELIQFVFQNPV